MDEFALSEPSSTGSASGSTRLAGISLSDAKRTLVVARLQQAVCGS